MSDYEDVKAQEYVDGFGFLRLPASCQVLEGVGILVTWYDSDSRQNKIGEEFFKVGSLAAIRVGAFWEFCRVEKIGATSAMVKVRGRAAHIDIKTFTDANVNNDYKRRGGMQATYRL